MASAAAQIVTTVRSPTSVAEATERIPVWVVGIPVRWSFKTCAIRQSEVTPSAGEKFVFHRDKFGFNVVRLED